MRLYSIKSPAKLVQQLHCCFRSYKLRIKVSSEIKCRSVTECRADCSAENDFRRASHHIHKTPPQLGHQNLYQPFLTYLSQHRPITAHMDANNMPSNTSTAPQQTVDIEVSPRGATPANRLIQAAKKGNRPRISWTKEICFMLAVAAEHQKPTSLIGTTHTDWNVVLAIMNEVLKRISSFARK